MPKKHASSHALATFLTVIASATLATLTSKKFRLLMEPFRLIGVVIKSLVGLPVSREIMTVLVFASFLSLIWGIGFHYIHE